MSFACRYLRMRGGPIQLPLAAPFRVPVRAAIREQSHANLFTGYKYLHSLRRAFSIHSSVGQQHHFDTRKFAIQLEREGFTPAQADAILKSLAGVLTDTTANLNGNLVSKDEFSRRVYQQKVDFTKLKSELQNLDRADFARINDEHERLVTDVEKTRQQFKETIAKVRANVRLDLNLEKGRVREESAGHELKIQEINARIDQELSNFKSQIEGTKVQVLQWLIGVCTGTFALVLAYIRLLT